jgi:putative ABC transport system permease protein
LCAAQTGRTHGRTDRRTEHQNYPYLHGWLQGFAYHITLSPLYFLGAGGAALVIAWATVFVHANRVANANPIHALRYE